MLKRHPTGILFETKDNLTEVFVVFLGPSKANVEKLSSIKPPPLPSTPFQIHPSFKALLKGQALI
jgi:hypothetical protein